MKPKKEKTNIELSLGGSLLFFNILLYILLNNVKRCHLKFLSFFIIL